MTSPTELWEAMKSYSTGIVKGNTADTLGAPVDLINTAVAPITKALGIYSDDPIGGSKTFRRLLNQSVEDSNVAETAGSMLSVGGAAKAMIVGAARLGKAGKISTEDYQQFITAANKQGLKGEARNAAMYDQIGMYSDKGAMKAVISDAEAKIPMEAVLDIRYGGKLGGVGSKDMPLKIENVISHPELFSLYPELKDITVYGDKNLPANTIGKFYPDKKQFAFHPDLNVEEMRSVALHELQHGVQKLEGWQGGGSPEQFISFNPSIVQQKIDEARKSGDPNLLAAAERFKEIANKQVDEGFNRYQNLAGEQEARFTQVARDLSLDKISQFVKGLIIKGDSPSTWDTKPIRPLP